MVLVLMVAGVLLPTLYGPSAFAIDDQYPPVISNFTAILDPSDYWTFSGTVTDEDDNVDGMTVYFGGVLAAYGYTAIVGPNGTFSMTYEMPDLESGIATAQTYDWYGLPSNLAQCYVFAIY